MYGPTRDFDGGYGIGGNYSMGYNDLGDVTWFGIGAGVGLTLGGSYGIGHTSHGFDEQPYF